MSSWSAPSRRSELSRALYDAARKPLDEVFRKRDRSDQADFKILAEAAEELEGDNWEKRHYNTALSEAIRRAIEELPKDDDPRRYSTMSWREIAATLCGFEHNDEAEQVKKPKLYDRRYEVVKRRSEGLAERSAIWEEVIEPTWPRLADALASLKPNEPMEPEAVEAEDGLALPAEDIERIKSLWISPSAYSEFGLDTYEGARNMYRHIAVSAATLLIYSDLSALDVVEILQSNKKRPDISGLDPDRMIEQLEWSASRLHELVTGEDDLEEISGRVFDEDGNVVDELVQATGTGFPPGFDEEFPNLISNYEIDEWMRVAIEHTEPRDLAAAHVEAIKVLTRQIRERLERSIKAQQDAEQLATANPNNVAVQQVLLLRERETKRQLAAADALRQAMQQASPAKVRYFAENVLWPSLDMGAAGRVNIEQLIEQSRNDEEFRQYRKS